MAVGEDGGGGLVGTICQSLRTDPYFFQSGFYGAFAPLLVTIFSPGAGAHLFVNQVTVTQEETVREERGERREGRGGR